MLRACALLRRQDSPVVPAMWRSLASKDWRTTEKEEASCMFQAHMLCSMDPAHAAVEAEFRKELVAHCVGVIDAFVDEPIPTTFHVKVSEALQGLGIRHENEVKDVVGRRYLDIVLIDFPKVCIQVDGPIHFTCNTRANMGPTRARDELMRHDNWKVIQVKFFEWRAFYQEYRSTSRGGTADVSKARQMYMKRLLTDNGV
eukprot:CAMPEP_0114311930 /NCGR_PEP_ID=MMETSP0059-20121206/20120_1 /TAXON_ID=36894 /ORGANISM="Pyramimonas parkeae, Strain CCMP726" /LENGTH=199 /DNA_ID=CAMNT_0001436203 /DNA_START=142 /DNA_END=738 /DNA_ORIENTATION=+